jgi:hypothetical protein
MRSLIMLALALATLAAAAPALAGSLTLQADDPVTNAEATAKHAVVMAHTTACMSPEKTVITATAEGIIKGNRISIPLRVIRLSAPGAYAVTRQWPAEGTWAVKMIVTNPEYKDHAVSILVPAEGGAAVLSRAKNFYNAPSESEIDMVLKQSTLE